MKLDEKELCSVLALRGSEDFATFVRAIARDCSDGNERLIRQSEGDEYLRGQVFKATQILDAINTAQQRLDRIRQGKT